MTQGIIDRIQATSSRGEDKELKKPGRKHVVKR